LTNIRLDLLAWECAHRNPLTIALETVREQRSLELYRRLTQLGFPADGDAQALSALLAAAINYLAVRSETSPSSAAWLCRSMRPGGASKASRLRRLPR
jgi:hypothetical protein